jgi:hypothetical protein
VFDEKRESMMRLKTLMSVTSIKQVSR